MKTNPSRTVTDIISQAKKFYSTIDKEQKKRYHYDITLVINSLIMAKDVLIRNIDEDTLEKLKKKAATNNRSLQAELKSLLKSHAGPDIEKIRAMARESIERYRAEGKKFSDSTEDIRKDRER